MSELPICSCPVFVLFLGAQQLECCQSMARSCRRQPFPVLFFQTPLRARISSGDLQPCPTGTLRLMCTPGFLLMEIPAGLLIFHGFGKLFPEGCGWHSRVLPPKQGCGRSVPQAGPVPQQGLFSLSTGERGRQAFEKMDRICCELRETAQEAEIEITVF